MYLPKAFEELRPEVLHALVRAHPLATIVMHADGALCADHIPLILQPPNDVMLGHVARANPLWRRAGDGAACLVVFSGVDHYISPNGYATKAQTGKVVPTWNYEAVHVNGTIRAIDDPAWLRNFLATLTHEHERTQPRPWRIDDAPADYIEAMLGAIVGIEITVQRITGKAKLSQNQPAENRRSLVAALRSAGDSSSTAMADAIELREPPR
jgi:transcriptional regulator